MVRADKATWPRGYFGRPLSSLPKYISISSPLSFSKRKGIVVNETAVVLYAQLLTGRKYVPGQSGQVHLEKQWSKQIMPFAYQTIVKVGTRIQRCT